jgi:flagellar biosynthetic protein FliR
MISISSVQIDAWIAAFIWPFLRIVAVMISDPLLGHRSIPIRVRIGFSLLLAVLVASTLPPPPSVELASAMGLMVAAQQILIGVAIGFSMRILMGAVEMAGSLVGLSMGLGFATFFDPQNSAQVPVVAQFMGLIGILIFFAINGHLMVISALVESFRVLPISATPFAAGGFHALALAGGQIFVIGVVMSLPVLAALLIVNVGMGVMSRAAPQLNLFAVGFPVTLFAGFAVLLMSLPYLAPHFVHMYEDGIAFALKTVSALAGGR